MRSGLSAYTAPTEPQVQPSCLTPSGPSGSGCGQFGTGSYGPNSSCPPRSCAAAGAAAWAGAAAADASVEAPWRAADDTSDRSASRTNDHCDVRIVSLQYRS